MSYLYVISFILLIIPVFLWIRFRPFLEYRSNMNQAFSGPPDNIVLGGTLDLTRAGGLTAAFFDKMHREHGEVVRFWLMGRLNISVASPPHIATVHRRAPMRPQETKQLIGFLGDESIIFMNDQDDVKAWRSHFVAHLKSPVVLQSLVTLASESLESTCADWTEETVDVRDVLERLLYRLNGTVLLNIDWEDPGCAAIFDSHIHVLANFMRWEILPIPMWVSSKYRAHRRALQTMWSAARTIVRRQRSGGDASTKIEPSPSDIHSSRTNRWRRTSSE